jgi:hypothetical protein
MLQLYQLLRRTFLLTQFFSLIVNTMYKTVFKACFQYLTFFDVLEGFTGGNRQMK